MRNDTLTTGEIVKSELLHFHGSQMTRQRQWQVGSTTVVTYPDTNCPTNRKLETYEKIILWGVRGLNVVTWMADLVLIKARLAPNGNRLVWHSSSQNLT